jgi:hypothetical protein
VKKAKERQMPKGRPTQNATDAPARELSKGSKGKGNGNGANLGFEAQLFLAADKLRKNLEPSDYKHVALGLIFLKHISNAFEAKRAALPAEDPAAAEDPDEYLAENVFWVPKEARWSHLQANAKQSSIGKLTAPARRSDGGAHRGHARTISSRLRRDAPQRPRNHGGGRSDGGSLPADAGQKQMK